MDLIDRGNLISPEVQVPLMLGGLEKLYGKKYLLKLLRSFDVKRIEDFFREEKYHLLSNFYHDIQVKVTNHDYRESIGIEAHRIELV